MLSVICLANMANNFNWISSSPVANKVAKFYAVSADQVNWLSLVFMVIAIPTGVFSFWLIDKFGVRSSLYLGAWGNLVGALVKLASVWDFTRMAIATNTHTYNYYILLVGQCVCAIAQPFIVFVTTKFANAWFADDQRALANTLALGSSIVGVLLGAISSPLLVASEDGTSIGLLLVVCVAISLVPALMSGFVRRSTPPTPPSYSVIINDMRTAAAAAAAAESREEGDETSQGGGGGGGETFCQGLSTYSRHFVTMFTSKAFVLLFLSFGLGLGAFNSLATLVEQIVCVRGYTDDDAGYFGGIMILSGIVGSVLAGLFVDATKRLEETAKVCFAMSALANILFTLAQLYDNQTWSYATIMLAFALIGFFGLPLLPVCMEMSVECVYPIPEETATGLLFIAGQIFGIAMIEGSTAIAKPVDTGSANIVQKCTMATSDAGALKAQDFTLPLYIQTSVIVAVTFVFIVQFKCSYLRLQSENKKLAEQIIRQNQLIVTTSRRAPPI